jgi:hypothetical protein
MWGEHQVFNKGRAYEEAVRVPLVMRLPGVEPKVVSALVAMNTDLPATILRLAGYSEQELGQGPLTSGRNLMPLIEGSETTGWRDHVLVEMWRSNRLSMVCAWGAVRTDRWKYVHYDYLDESHVVEEMYDLLLDPLELESLHHSPAHADIRGQLTTVLAGERGLTITGIAHPWGTVANAEPGVAYEYHLTTAGGARPITFSLFSETTTLTGLPPGLQLPADGAIIGVTNQTGSFEFEVRVDDTSVSPYHGGPQWHVVRLLLTVPP